MNELNDDKSKTKSNDKVLLILSAIGFILCFLIFMFFLDKLKITKEWQFYIIMSILYVFGFIYGINKLFGLKKKVTNLVSILLLIFFAVFPIIVGFSILYFKFLPFPKRNFTYFVIEIILIPAATVCFDESLKFIERKKHSNKKGEKNGKTNFKED